MSPKLAIPALMIALAVAPAALLAQRNQEHHFAFTNEGRPFAAAEQFAGRAIAAASGTTTPETTVAPIVITAVRPRAANAPAKGAPASVCQSWRALHAGPRARAADAPMVLACDGPPHESGAVPPTQTARSEPPSRESVTHGAPWHFTVDLAAPR